MSISQLNPMQVHFVKELISREILGVQGAIEANKEMIEEAKKNPRFANDLALANSQLEHQLEIWNEIQEIIQAPTKGFLTSIGLLSDRDCLIKVHTADGNYLHQSWEVGDEVMAYENMPCNYPAGYWSAYPNKEAYFEAIRKVDWINEEENIHQNNVDEDIHGVTFPFEQEEYNELGSEE